MSKFAVTQLIDKADRRTAWELTKRLSKAVPYRIHTILTDDDIQSTEQHRNRNTAGPRQIPFDMICEANGIRTGSPNRTIPGRTTRACPGEGRGRADGTAPSRKRPSNASTSKAMTSFGRTSVIRRRLQLCPPAQNTQRPHAPRIHRQDLDLRAAGSLSIRSTKSRD